MSYFESQNITWPAIALYTSVGLAVYILAPKILQHVRPGPVRHKSIILAAALIFACSLLLPSPLIHGQNTNFNTHVVGGGIFSGLIWLYLKLNLKLRLSPLMEILSLYLLVSGLGVANEMFEFFANGIGILNIPGTDTWWDLFANNAGATLFWIIYRLFLPKR